MVIFDIIKFKWSGDYMERWFIKNKSDPGIEYKKLGINNVIYKILLNREINTEEEI